MALGADMSLKSRWFILNTAKYIFLGITMSLFLNAVLCGSMPSVRDTVFLLFMSATVVWFVEALKPGSMKKALIK